MGTAKRERQKALRRQQRRVWAEEDRKRRNRQRVLVYGGVFVVVVAAVLGAFALLDDDEAGTPVAGDTDLFDDGVPSTSGEPGAAGDATTTTAAEPVEVTVPPAGASVEGETPCPAADGSSERTTSFENPPPMCIDLQRTYRAEIETSKGAFSIDLDATNAPSTVNNFVVLARFHYYDGVAFHRIIPGFVVQGGDAVGPTPGLGGPGYQFDDELPSGSPAYEIGSVAMANSGADTNGSQFFVLTGEDGAALPAEYSLFGTVSEGMDVVSAIEAVGTQSGTPTEVVTIDSITITES